jgi:hypothetical protein
MARVMLIVVAAGIVLLGGALLMLGAFPPTPAQHPVVRTLANDRFQPH